MRPFRSVTSALRYYRRWFEALSSAKAIDPEPQIRGESKREEVLAVCLSINICLEVLTEGEKETLDQVFNHPWRRLSRAGSKVYGQATSKLGVEMRRRGVVE